MKCRKPQTENCARPYDNNVLFFDLFVFFVVVFFFVCVYVFFFPLYGPKLFKIKDHRSHFLGGQEFRNAI